MTALVLGNQNSGKSALAEALALQTGDQRRYYLATMKICDDAGRERVQKHRKQREGKGFVTIERLSDIAKASDDMEAPGEATVLLECVSNLVGNELFEKKGDSKALAGAVFSDIKSLADQVHHLILVSNTYEADGEGYDASTRLYVRLLDEVNERLIPWADQVYDLRKTGENGQQEEQKRSRQ